MSICLPNHNILYSSLLYHKDTLLHISFVFFPCKLSINTSVRSYLFSGTIFDDSGGICNGGGRPSRISPVLLHQLPCLAIHNSYLVREYCFRTSGFISIPNMMVVTILINNYFGNCNHSFKHQLYNCPIKRENHL